MGASGMEFIGSSGYPGEELGSIQGDPGRIQGVIQAGGLQANGPEGISGGRLPAKSTLPQICPPPSSLGRGRAGGYAGRGEGLLAAGVTS